MAELTVSNIFKDVIISFLEYLSEQEIIDVFAFVISPSHIHVVWRINEENGEEAAQDSYPQFDSPQTILTCCLLLFYGYTD